MNRVNEYLEFPFQQVVVDVVWTPFIVQISLQRELVGAVETESGQRTVIFLPNFMILVGRVSGLRTDDLIECS